MILAAFQRGLRLALALLCLALPACAATAVPESVGLLKDVRPTATVIRHSFHTSPEQGEGDSPSRALGAGKEVRQTPLTPDGAVSETAAGPDLWATIETGLRRDVALALEDYGQFYSPGNLAWTGLSIGLSGVLAHTSADRSIRDWYQRRVRGGTADDLAEVVNVAGQLWVVWPVCVEAWALAGNASEDYAFAGGMFEWSNRSLRAIAVGFPPVVVLYGLLGSGRPDREDSRWHPFRDIRGVSGHTFTGAIPFLTAAAMTDDPLLKAVLFAGSTATGWSRLHKDRHYLSQIVLGWWIAYFAVRSVDRTQQKGHSLSVVPVTGEGPGLGLHFRY